MKPKYLQPTEEFRYVIPHRLDILAEPRGYEDQAEIMPALTPMGVRQSALKGAATDRINEVSYPYVRRIVQLKRLYRKRFSRERMARLDRLLELSNATCYSKLANCQIDLKKSGADKKKKRSWTDSDWKKHMDLIGPIAVPKPVCQPPPVDRGHRKPLEQMLARIEEMASLPEHKVYRPLIEEPWYRDPTWVSPKALKYKPSERMKQLAIPKPIPSQD